MNLFRRKPKPPEVLTVVHREIEIVLQREWVAPPEPHSATGGPASQSPPPAKIAKPD